MKKKKYWLPVVNLILILSIVCAAIIQLSFAEKEVFAKDQELQLVSKENLTQLSAGETFIVTIKDTREKEDLGIVTEDELSKLSVAEQADVQRIWSVPLPEGVTFDEAAQKQLMEEEGSDATSPQFTFDQEGNRLIAAVPAATQELNIQLTAKAAGDYVLKAADYVDDTLISDDLEVSVLSNNAPSTQGTTIPYLGIEPRVGPPYTQGNVTFDAYPTDDATKESNWKLVLTVNVGTHPGYIIDFAYGRYPPDSPEASAPSPGDSEYTFTRTTDANGQIILDFREISGDPSFSFKSGYFFTVHPRLYQPNHPPGVGFGPFNLRVADETKPDLTTLPEVKIYEGTSMPKEYEYASTVVDHNNVRNHSQFDRNDLGVAQVFPRYGYPHNTVPDPNYRKPYSEIMEDIEWGFPDRNYLIFQYDTANTAPIVLNGQANQIPGLYDVSILARDEELKVGLSAFPVTGLNFSDPQPSSLRVLERPTINFVNQLGQPINYPVTSMKILPLTMEPDTYVFADYNNATNGDVKGTIDSILATGNYGLPSGWETEERRILRGNYINVWFEEPPTAYTNPKRVNLYNADYLKSLSPRDFVTNIQDDVSLPQNVTVEFDVQPDFDTMVQTTGMKAVAIRLTDELGLQRVVRVAVTVYDNRLQVNYLSDTNVALAPSTTINGGLSGTVINLRNEQSVLDTIASIEAQGYTIIRRPSDETGITLDEIPLFRDYVFQTNGSLYLKSAPSRIDFGQKITRNYGAIHDDQPTYDIPLVVADERNFGNNNWTVTARLTEVFTSTGNTSYTLPTALKYKSDTGTSDMALNQSIVLAKSNTGVRGDHNISQLEWVNKSNGFIFDIGVDEYREMEDYQARITYTVEDVYQP